MIRVVIDTNVLVSSILSAGGNAARIMYLISDNKIRLLYSPKYRSPRRGRRGSANVREQKLPIFAQRAERATQCARSPSAFHKESVEKWELVPAQERSHLHSSPLFAYLFARLVSQTLQRVHVKAGNVMHQI